MRFLSLAVLSLLLASGGGRDEYDLAPVTGTVTLAGQPPADGVINFQPIAGEKQTAPGPGSTARTNAEGKYSLETVFGKPGAVIGSHRVKIYSYSPETINTPDTGAGPVQERVPQRYNYRSTLTFDVPTDRTKQADFDLTR